MKANRKFLEKEDGERAVSAVIGVILMVAITVAIAATVYVYVSGMMGTGTVTAPTLTFTQVDKATENTLTIISADPSNLDWGDLELRINGTATLHIRNPSNTSFTTGSTITAGEIIDVSYSAGDMTTDPWDSDRMYGPYTVSVRHIPTNTLIATYDFV